MVYTNTDDCLDTDLQCCGDAPGGGVAAADDRLSSLVRLPALGQQLLRRHTQWHCNMRHGIFGSCTA